MCRRLKLTGCRNSVGVVVMFATAMVAADQPPTDTREDIGMFGFGLVDVKTDHLVMLFRALVREDIECPLTIVGVSLIGLQDHHDLILDHLRGLDASGVRAVLSAVIAERRKQERAR